MISQKLQHLGSVACTLIPFAQSMAILVNSIILVFIAFDRYMAIKNINKASWKPSKLLCISCCLLTWAFAAAVSSPMLMMYNYDRIDISLRADQKDSEMSFQFYDGFMCGRKAVSF